MKAALFTAIRTMELREMEKPTPGENEVLIKVRAAGICGSDMSGFLGHSPRRQPGLVMGHEVVGELEDGTRVTINPLVTCGQCRACRRGRQNQCATWSLLGMDRRHGGFAEYVVAPRRNVFPLQDRTSDLAAVMIEPLANAFHMCAMALDHAGPRPTALLLGGGTMGAVTLAAAQACGIRVLAVSEPSPGRREAASRLGAPNVSAPGEADLASIFGKEGPDVVFDAVGIAATRQEAAKSVGTGGIAVFLGLHENETTLGFHDLVRREIRLQGSFAYNDTDFANALQFVESGEVDFTPWSDLRPLDDAQSAFEEAVTSPGSLLKIALRP